MQSTMTLTNRIRVVQDVAREAGDLALSYYSRRDELTIEQKGRQDWVSQADREVELLITKRLLEAFPTDRLLGEEHGIKVGEAVTEAETAGIWVVDPIDGTTPFLKGIPFWCISIAYVVGDEIEIGVVYSAVLDEMYLAVRGKGATLNGKPIYASSATNFTEGSVGVGMSVRAKPEFVLHVLQGVFERGGMFNRMGSCAMTLAYVASGRLLGYVEQHTKSWDCLAGLLLVREAGGQTNNFLNEDSLHEGGIVLAGAAALFGDILEISGHSE